MKIGVAIQALPFHVGPVLELVLVPFQILMTPTIQAGHDRFSLGSRDDLTSALTRARSQSGKWHPHVCILRNLGL